MIQDILKQPMGELETNCYIVKLKSNKTLKEFELIVDPGVDAYDWIKQNCINPKAILNTHGHYDHVWSNRKVAKAYNIAIYTPSDDCFMLEFDHSGNGMPLSHATYKVSSDINEKKDDEIDNKIYFDDILVEFFHFPGHTQGCSVIKIENHIFSGDFIFAGTIGRSDFVFSNVDDMKKSVTRILSWQENVNIHPGHGEDTTLDNEREQLKAWQKAL